MGTFDYLYPRSPILIFVLLIILFNICSSGNNKLLGDISYEVKREFWGNIEMVGNSIAVSGRTHGNTDPNSSGNAYVDEQSLLESELGYFTMIDAVASEGVEGEKQSS